MCLGPAALLSWECRSRRGNLGPHLSPGSGRGLDAAQNAGRQASLLGEDGPPGPTGVQATRRTRKNQKSCRPL